MLLHLFADPHSGIDIQQCIGRVRQPLDYPRFVRAWQQVMDRHAGLRTWFSLHGLKCTQHISVGACVEATLEDWRSLSPEARDARFESFLQADRRNGCRLTECPVWRVKAFDCGEEGFRFVFTHPHAIVDATSAFIILRDLFAFYDGNVSLEGPAGSFTEFVNAHARRDVAAAEVRWREVFRGFAGPSSLCIPKPAAQATGQGSFEKVLAADLSARIRAVAEREKLSLSAVVKAAWCILLSRLSASDDVVFGEVRSGRRKDVQGMQSMVGMFVTTVPVRVALPARITFRELVGELRQQQASVRDHEQTPLADIQRWCGLAPEKALFETALVFDPLSVTAAMKRGGGAWLDRDISHRERTSVPITLNVSAEPDFRVKVSYDRSRFCDDFMQRLPGYFQAALEAFAEDPDCAVAKVNILPQQELDQVQRDWNATRRSFSTQSTIPDAFARHAQLHPGRLALICGERQLSYRELENSATVLAVAMREQGVARGALVGICMDRSIDMVVSMLAAMKAGGGYVPLDPSYPDERLRFMVEDARPALIVASQRHAPRFADSGARVMGLEALHLPGIARGKQALPDPARAEDLAYVIYTSGSTGRPKGVMITQRNVANCFAGMDHVLPAMSTGTWLAVTSISFDISVIELFWTLTRGYTVVLCRDSADAPEITRLLQT
ncbi:MAG TPA: condensation domain-containing protein, partial [Vicinamibacterales bacterium]|nr:condensation domain-containing protein [Vicinamibacterales bacterium]